MRFDDYGEETAVAPGSAGKDGELRLRFRPDREGRTYVAEDYARVPFHVGRGMYPDPECDDLAFIYIQNPTGATVQGDRKKAKIVVEQGAKAHVTTGSSEKVHEMETSYAKSETKVRVDEDAYLEYVPDPTILHDGARYDTKTDIRVTEGGAAVVSDIVVAGRLAHGESFGFDAYRSSVTARDGDGTLLFDDTTEITDADEDGRRRTVFDGNSVFGDVYVVAPGYAEETDETTEGLRDAVASAVEEEADDAVTAGVTALPNDAGVVLRFVANSVGEARHTKRAGWDAARRRLIGVPVPPRRR